MMFGLCTSKIKLSSVQSIIRCYDNISPTNTKMQNGQGKNLGESGTLGLPGMGSQEIVQCVLCSTKLMA